MQVLTRWSAVNMYEGVTPSGRHRLSGACPEVWCMTEWYVMLHGSTENSNTQVYRISAINGTAASNKFRMDCLLLMGWAIAIS
jgi:hypothetical protein